MPEHGGNLSEATVRFGEPEGGWIDLSTGINPTPYPVPPPRTLDWQRLPEADELENTAAKAFGAPAALALPGSQAAISLLPALRPAGRVAIPAPEYAEHAAAWHHWHHRIDRIAPEVIAAGPPDHLPWQALILSHPNNPTGRRYPTAILHAWRAALAAQGGWLVIDEAFCDAEPEHSLATEAGTEGLLILRSLGKFYGLAGARVGFLLAPATVRQRLAALLGPWPIAGPSRAAAQQALRDESWRQRQQAQLRAATQRLEALLATAGLPTAGGTPLFRWVPCRAPRQEQARLARAGIWVRAFDNPSGLRFGLPGDEPTWQRLAKALESRRQAPRDPRHGAATGRLER
ncbi:MAG: threonine-phosphate decarboxylase CobD [Halorhodospira sp.]